MLCFTRATIVGWLWGLPSHSHGGPSCWTILSTASSQTFSTFPRSPYFMPTAAYLYHPMPLDLLYNGHDPNPTNDSIESVHDDGVNESLGCLEEENPNLADPLTDPILDHAATSLECWFCTSHPHSEIMDLLKQVEHPANCKGLKCKSCKSCKYHDRYVFANVTFGHCFC